MNKRAMHHIWTRLRSYRAVYFLVAAGVFLVVGVIAMRQNNLTALALRDEVLRTDEQNGDVETALRDLRLHVYSHMNSNLGGGASNIAQPIQLKFRYERLVQAEKDKVSTANEKIYNNAQTDCENRFPVGLSGSGRIPCIEAYVSSRSIKQQPIPDSLYKFDFIAPSWSLDMAGFSLLLSAIFLLLFAVRVYLEHWMRDNLKQHA